MNRCIQRLLVSTLCGLFVLPPNVAHSSELSLGMSDSLGVFGISSLTFPVDDRYEDWFIVVGTTILVIGGAGVGWQHHFSEDLISPFTTVTGFAAYILPVGCVTDDCRVYVAPHLSLAGGVEVRSQRQDKGNAHLQLGIYTAFNLREGEFFESPSDKPLLWPLLNLKMSR